MKDITCFDCIHKNVCAFKREATEIQNKYNIHKFSKLFQGIACSCNEFNKTKEAEK